jgi:AAA+ ATPase superfamily predicted ATPase
MYRTSIKQLINCKLDKGIKPLVFFGARQVGKTWLIREFGKGVKSGYNLKAKSFNLFCEKHKPETAIRTSLSDYRKESWMTNAPLYIIGNYFV